MILPFKGNFRMSQDWNDPCCRAGYYKYGLLGHNGQDFACPVGTAILAPHSGKVIESRFDNGYGYYVKIENKKEGSILAHFKELPKVGVNQEVKEGQIVGYSGNTGNSTGPHLHWGYYRLPRKRDNGFSGTIDQTHWMDVENDEELLKKIEELRKQRDEKKREIEENKKTIEMLETKYDLEKKRGMELAQINEISQKTIDTLNEELKRLRTASGELQDVHDKYKKETDKIIGNLRKDNKKLGEEIANLEQQLKKKLENLTFWQKVKILFL